MVQVQQQIQVLAAEQRNIDEQSRQFETRFERLRADRNALAAPDEARLANLRSQLDEAQETQELTAARLEELQETVPRLDEERRERQQAVNQETARQTDLSARMEALKALQEKVKTDGKLQPWLSVALWALPVPTPPQRGWRFLPHRPLLRLPQQVACRAWPTCCAWKMQACAPC